MRTTSYRGRRIAGGKNNGGRREGTGHQGFLVPQFLCHALFFPVLLLYLELVLHIVRGANLKFFPIYALFAISLGFLFSGLTMIFPPKVNAIVAKVLAFLLSIIYIVENIAKIILQTYYPFSSLGVAAGNKLSDYADVIVSTVIKNIPVILVLLLPSVLLMIFGKRCLGFHSYRLPVAGAMLVGMLVFHLLGLGVVHLPWGGDLPPKQLYQLDTNIDDQVEQLGLCTMLRLDIKHQFVKPRQTMGSDFENLNPITTPDTSDMPVINSEEPTPEIDRSPNIMEVDLAKLAEETSNNDIEWLANFFNSVAPTNKNEYTGMFEGYNVIQIVMEGFSGYAIDPELTPTLYKLTHEGFVFHNYYTALHFTSTSNGECQTLLGLYPKNGMPITMSRTGELGTNMYFSLAQQLKREGYLVMGYHGNGNMYNRLQSHTNLGYDWRQYQSGLELEMGESKPLWPQRDSYVIEASVDDYINSDQPFHIYYLTISGHMPYSANRVVKPYLETVRALPYSETTQNYIATAMEVDRSLELLLDKLEEAGKLDNTLIVATGDHVPYFNIDTLEELAGEKFGSSEAMEALNESDINFDVYKSSLILWSASMKEPVEVDKVCCQVDILPTVSNLLGLEYDSRMLAGTDILSESEGLVVFSSRCWKTDQGFYNRFTQEFTPAEGVTMTAEEQEEYVSRMKRLVGYKLDSTAMIVENDFYDYVFGE